MTSGTRYHLSEGKVSLMSEEKKAASFANKAYAAAEKILRERHKAEFEEILSAYYEAAGVERKVRLSKEEREAQRLAERALKEAAKEAERRAKAKATLDALLAEFPDLGAEDAAEAADDSAA